MFDDLDIRLKARFGMFIELLGCGILDVSPERGRRCATADLGVFLSTASVNCQI